MQKLRGLFPRKTAASVAALTGRTLRSAERWLAGSRHMDAEDLGALLRSDAGLSVLVAVMGKARPTWWRTQLAVMAIGGVRRRQAADARALRSLEEALDADRDLTATIARAEAALSLQDADFYRPHLDALGAMAGVPDRAVAQAAASGSRGRR